MHDKENIHIHFTVINGIFPCVNLKLELFID